MSTWSGWAVDFLSAVSFPNTANNRKFLNDWADNANHPGLDRNPIDLHLKEPGSTDGPAGPLVGQHFQNYTTHTWSRTAFQGQITSSSYPQIRQALHSGNPYTFNDPGKVATQLGMWGSTTYANIYLDAALAGPPTKLKGPHALKGWSSMQKSVNRHLPAALKQSQKARQATLRDLRRIRKVMH